MGVGHREGSGRAGWEACLGCPDHTALQGSSLHVGSDLLKFEEPVSTQEPGTFFFRTPKVRLAGQAGQAAGSRGRALGVGVGVQMSVCPAAFLESKRDPSYV